MSQEVKVGQIYRSKVTNGDYHVVGSDAKNVYLSGASSVVSVPWGNLEKAFSWVVTLTKDEQESLRNHIDNIANSSPLMRKCFGIGIGDKQPLELRDHFAGLAMQAMVLEAVSEEIKNGNCEAVKAMTNAAYMVADEMIKARGE